MIEIRQVGKRYTLRDGTEVAALLDVDLRIAPGEFVTLLGPSGCGKSTLLLIVAGLLPPSRGDILVRGQRVEGPGPDRTVIFQDYGLFPWLTALGNVESGLRLRGVPRDERRTIGRKYIKLVNLQGCEDRYPYELSGGMKQRVAIARALALEPETMLMDEPFGALDALTRERMQDELLDLWTLNRKTIIFVTHSIDEATLLSDRVVVFTRSPGRVKHVVDIDLPRPRKRSLPGFIDIREQLATLIKEEMTT